MKKRLIMLILSLALVIALFPLRASAAREVLFGQTVAAGYARSFAVKTDGSLWYWGKGTMNPSNEDNLPERMSPAKLMDDVVSVSAASFYAVITKSDGSLWLFGNGYLGDGSKYTYYTAPTKMPIDNVASVAVGYSHILVMKNDGTVWSWGGNMDGQLGGGYNYEYFTPRKVFDGAVAISAGMEHSFAVKSDRSLWGWGGNARGQLGGASDDSKALNAVKLMDGVKSAYAVGLSTFIIKNDDSLWGCGNGVVDSVGNSALDVPQKLMDNALMACDRGYAITLDHTLMYRAEGTSGYANVADNIAFAAAGPDACLMVDFDGNLLGRGTNAYWGLGLGDDDQQTYYEAAKIMSGIAVPGTVYNAPSDWARGDVAAAKDLGLVPASLQSRYGANITRAEFSALAVSLIEQVSGQSIDAFLANKAVTIGAPFSDTTDKNVAAIAALGIVDGVGDGKFNPSGEITREQSAKMLLGVWFALSGSDAVSAAPRFADYDAISVWARTQVELIAGLGVMNGVGENKFAPQSPYTREQSIITALRLYNMLGKAVPI